MQRLDASMIARLLLPAGLFGYAVASNVGLPARWHFLVPPTKANLSALFHGSLTARVETLYRKGLPHNQLAAHLVGAGRYLLFHEGRPGVIAGKEGYLFTDEEFRQGFDRQAVIDRAVIGIEDVSHRLAMRGIRLIFVPLPAKTDIYSDELQAGSSAATVAGLYDDLLDRLRQVDIATVDSRDALLTARADSQVYLRTDTHWTPAGAAVVAKAVVQEALGGGGEEFELVTAPARKVEGDLVRFVTGGAFADLIGLADEDVTPFIAERRETAQAELDIFGASSSIPVTLVGTSYSANEVWSFAAFLSFWSGLDVANASLIGQGPVVPMRDFIASLEQSDSLPQTVIWEFPIRYLTDPELWNETIPQGNRENENG
ncbi:unnamed protein product [Ciceribacter sp. T2.26MG-112.2]|uniref:alginate O-acetyltransferase AlgX-related protein n=1 Tax=Ciceribacter sp. T2.26MG-112.2 TaxID=3137154 RepID=UPI000E196CB0|nr:hypothetical protein [Ciceribacter naphthalenivorans]SSC71362.1 unnamed protein product [Ciceribacter naphthalenivorans]